MRKAIFVFVLTLLLFAAVMLYIFLTHATTFSYALTFLCGVVFGALLVFGFISDAVLQLNKTSTAVQSLCNHTERLLRQAHQQPDAVVPVQPVEEPSFDFGRPRSRPLPHTTCKRIPIEKAL